MAITARIAGVESAKSSRFAKRGSLRRRAGRPLGSYQYRLGRLRISRSPDTGTGPESLTLSGVLPGEAAGNRGSIMNRRDSAVRNDRIYTPVSMSPTPTGSSGLLRSAAEEYPLPIARACRRCLKKEGGDAWQEWEHLTVGVLSAVLRYLSHLLLSDLAATGARPPQLFHRIQSVLSRPKLGHYAGFLRETARYYRERNLACAFPELIDFLFSADVDCALTGDGSALIGTLVEYRNLWAHGRLENRQALRETAARVRHLTFELLCHISFLTAYPLQLEDGTVLMGTEVSHLPKEPGMLLLVRVHEVGLRPLLLKLKGRDIGLLDDFDAGGPRIGYRGVESYVRFTKKDLGKGDGRQVLTELLDLLKRVRAIDAPLEHPEWDDLRERARVIAERTLDGYRQTNKYAPKVVQIDGLEPEILQRAVRLRFLQMISLKPQSSAFYQRFRAVLATGLPNLESLVIEIPEAGQLRRSYNTSRHARRADMLTFLEALEAVAEGRPEPGR